MTKEVDWDSAPDGARYEFAPDFRRGAVVYYVVTTDNVVYEWDWPRMGVWCRKPGSTRILAQDIRKHAKCINAPRALIVTSEQWKRLDELLTELWGAVDKGNLAGAGYSVAKLDHWYEVVEGG